MNTEKAISTQHYKTKYIFKEHLQYIQYYKLQYQNKLS